MPRCTFLDGATQQVIEGLNFGGSPQVVYDVGGVLVYAPIGGTDITIADNVATLNPLGLTSGNALGNWNIISETDKGTCEWKLNLQNASTAEVKNGVYPFNTVDGITYELECQAGVWVMATCGGYEIESTWVGQLANECYRLKGTNEIISAQYEYLGAIDDVCPPLCAVGSYFDCVSGTCVPYSSYVADTANASGFNLEILTKSSYTGSDYEVIGSGVTMGGLILEPHAINFLIRGGIGNPRASLTEEYKDWGWVVGFGGYQDIRQVSLGGYTSLGLGTTPNFVNTITVICDTVSAISMESAEFIDSTPFSDGYVPTNPFTDPYDLAIIHAIMSFTVNIYGVK